MRTLTLLAACLCATGCGKSDSEREAETAKVDAEMKKSDAEKAARFAVIETLRSRLVVANGLPRDTAPTKCAAGKGTALLADRDMVAAVTKPAIDLARDDGRVEAVDDWKSLSSDAVRMLREHDWYAAHTGDRMNVVSAEADNAKRLAPWVTKGSGDFVVIIDATTKTKPDIVGEISIEGEAPFDEGALHGRAIAIDPVGKRVLCQVTFAATNSRIVKGGIDKATLRVSAVEDLAHNAHKAIVDKFAAAGLAITPVEDVY
ncbi:MAG TPA: hypothetical protein VGM90_06665 [Kofleriaceae bacterium]|jgi:hypothetical protein